MRQMQASRLPKDDQASRGAHGPARILVVEDERIVALDLASTLRRLGYDLEGPVDNGEQAIQLARASRPDLVLMDIRLRGELDGIAAGAAITAETHAPIIFLTAHSDRETLDRAKRASPYSYLVKPFRQDDLRCAIEVTLHRHAVELELLQRERDIERLNHELEARVRERTAQLETANHELEAFSYSVAHDLRAPLRAVDGFTQMVLERSGSALDAEDCARLQRVRGAAQHMAKLIDDLLELARVVRSEAGNASVNLSALAGDIDRELRTLNPQRVVHFSAEPNVRGQGDPTLVHCILHNLLSNAWKFTTPVASGRIEFGARRSEGQLRYFVRDNGVGFDMKNARQLFGVFQRLHHERDFEGNGIGLAIVERAVRRHGGRAWAEATPGGGATFWFTLGSGDERA